MWLFQISLSNDTITYNRYWSVRSPYTTYHYSCKFHKNHDLWDPQIEGKDCNSILYFLSACGEAKFEEKVQKVSLPESRRKRTPLSTPRDRDVNYCSTTWGKLLINLSAIDGGPSITSREGKLFRRRFRVPWDVFCDFVEKSTNSKLFGESAGEKYDFSGRAICPVAIKVPSSASTHIYICVSACAKIQRYIYAIRTYFSALAHTHTRVYTQTLKMRIYAACFCIRIRITVYAVHKEPTVTAVGFAA